MATSPQRGTPNIKLRTYREQRHLTQAELAELIGASEVTVSRWERGETFPTPYSIRKLCEVFQTTAKELGLDRKSRMHGPSRVDTKPVPQIYVVPQPNIEIQEQEVIPQVQVNRERQRQEIVSSDSSFVAPVRVHYAHRLPLPTKTCPSCNTKQHYKNTFCTKCGTRLKKEEFVPAQCTKCHQLQKSREEKYCPNCGTQFPDNPPSITTTLVANPKTEGAQHSTSTQICPHCHKALGKQDTFCGSCGYSLTDSNETTVWH